MHVLAVKYLPVILILLQTNVMEEDRISEYLLTFY